MNTYLWIKITISQSQIQSNAPRLVFLMKIDC